MNERIRSLRAALRSAEACEKPDAGLVEPGMLVTVSLAHQAEASTFLLGSSGIIAADPSIGADVYSPTSPLGQVLDGARVGDTVRYLLPSGRETSARVIGAKPFK